MAWNKWYPSMSSSAMSASPARRTAYLGQGNGAVQGDNRGRGLRQELVVQRKDLGPVRLGRGGRVGVNSVDGGLELIRPWLVTAKAGGDYCVAVVDQIPVPERSILLGEEDN